MPFDSISSSDPSEIAHFSALADRWWDPKGELATLHAINPIRLDYIHFHAPLTSKAIIDVGCGGGLLAEGMAERGGNVTGIDLSQPALLMAKKHSEQSDKKISYLNISAEKMADLHPEAFDVVTCLELLEHSPNPAAIISACARLVKPKGDLFFSTINRTAKAWLFAILGAEYVLKLLPKNTHDYRRFIRPATLSHWLRAAGLECIHMTGLQYHPFRQTATLTPDVSINYMIHARKP